MACGPISSEHIRGLLECPVCFDVYNNPKELDCQHTYCETPCLQQLYQIDTKTIQCPLCRHIQPVPGGNVSQLKPNRTLQRLIEVSNPGKVLEASSKCEVCGSSNLSSLCVHCKRMICENCKQQHTQDMLRDVQYLMERTKGKASSMKDDIVSHPHAIQSRLDELRKQLSDSAQKARDRITQREKELNESMDFTLSKAITAKEQSEDIDTILQYCSGTDSSLKDLDMNELEATRLHLIDCSTRMENDIIKVDFDEEEISEEIKKMCVLDEHNSGSMPIETKDTTEAINACLHTEYSDIGTRIANDSLESYKEIRGPVVTIRDGFSDIQRVAISPINGDVAVTDYVQNVVKIFDIRGKFRYDIGCHGTAPGQFSGPCGLDFTEYGCLVVADSLNHRIQIFDEDGEFIRTVSRYGNQPYQLDTPTDVCVDRFTNDKYVCDQGNNRIQRFNEKGGGAPQNSLTCTPFQQPRRIVFHPWGYIYVIDADGLTGYNSEDNWNPESHKIMKVASNNPLAIAANGDFACYALAKDAMVYIYNVNNIESEFRFPSPEAICMETPIVDLAIGNGHIVVAGQDFVEIY